MNPRGDELALIDAALRWRAAGARVFWVSVAQVWRSAPRPAGTVMLVRGDGLTLGAVSGGCVEDDVRDWAQAQVAPLTAPVWREYGIADDHAQRRGLACGGRLALTIEEVRDDDWLRHWRAAVDARACVARRVYRNDGRIEVVSVPAFADMPLVEAEFFQFFNAPEWRLLLIGAGALSVAVARFATLLDFRVIVCEPRAEYAAAWEPAQGEWTAAMPDDAVRAWARDSRCAVLALTHDPRLDDLGLWEALLGPAFYIGALGSRTTAAARRRRLQELGIGEDVLARLHGPAGLPLGGKSHAEIALSMVAEITARRCAAAYQNAARLRKTESLETAGV